MLGSLVSQGSEGRELLLLRSDGPWCLELNASWDREGSRGVAGALDRGQVDLVAPVLLGSSGQDDQSLTVCLESVSVQLQGLLGLVATSVVHWDTDGASLLLSDTGSLELLVGEALALTQLGVVLDCWASDSGAERLGGSEAKGGSLGDSGIAARLLLAWLVEVDPDSPLPVLSEAV